MEPVWVHMRNCLHKCNRTQVSPATNEMAEGVETFAPPSPGLTEAVREGRTFEHGGGSDLLSVLVLHA